MYGGICVVLLFFIVVFAFDDNIWLFLPAAKKFQNEIVGALVMLYGYFLYKIADKGD